MTQYPSHRNSVRKGTAGDPPKFGEIIETGRLALQVVKQKVIQNLECENGPNPGVAGRKQTHIKELDIQSLCVRAVTFTHRHAM